MAAMKVCWIFGHSARLKSGDGTKNWKTNFRIGFSGHLSKLIVWVSLRRHIGKFASSHGLVPQFLLAASFVRTRADHDKGWGKVFGNISPATDTPLSSNANSTRLPKNFVNTSPQLEKWKAWRDEARLLGDYLAPISRNVRLLGAHFKDSFWRSPHFNLAWGMSKKYENG